jgi:hypothetical protein
MARELERRWPGVVEVWRRFGRAQHYVKYHWERFQNVPRLKPEYAADGIAVPRRPADALKGTLLEHVPAETLGAGEPVKWCYVPARCTCRRNDADRPSFVRMKSQKAETSGRATELRRSGFAHSHSTSCRLYCCLEEHAPHRWAGLDGEMYWCPGVRLDYYRMMAELIRSTANEFGVSLTRGADVGRAASVDAAKARQTMTFTWQAAKKSKRVIFFTDGIVFLGLHDNEWCYIGNSQEEFRQWVDFWQKRGFTPMRRMQEPSVFGKLWRLRDRSVFKRELRPWTQSNDYAEACGMSIA